MRHVIWQRIARAGAWLLVAQLACVSVVMAEESEEAEGGHWLVHTEQAPMRDASSEDVLGAEALAAIGARSGQEILRSLAGVQLSQHGSEGKAAQFFVRGFDAAHGTDLTLGIDGLAINQPSHIHGHGYADSGMVIPEVVREVRFRKGPFGLDQGNLSTAGDIQFGLGVPEYRRGQALQLELGWPAGARVGAYAAPTEREDDEFVAGEWVYDGGAYDNRQTHRAGLLAQARRGPVLFRGGANRASFGLPGAIPQAHLNEGRAQRSDAYSPETTGESAQSWLGAKIGWEAGSGEHESSVDSRFRRFDGTENFTGQFFDEEQGDAYRQFQQSLDVVVGHRSRFAMTEDWSLKVLGGGSVDHLDQFEEDLDAAGDRQELARGLVGRQWSGHLGAGVEGFVGDWGYLEAGVRGEVFAFDVEEDAELGGEGGRDAVGALMPRGRAHFYMSEAVTGTVSAGRGIRGPEARVFAGDREAPPDEDLRQFQGGEPVITAIDAAEAGLILEPTNGVEVSATAFGFYASGEYVYDHVSRVQLDLGATRRIGAEVAAQLDLGEVGQLRGHVVGTQARFVDDGQDVPFAPPLEAGALFYTQRTSGWFGGLEWRGVSERPLPFGATARGWHLFNLHGGWRVGSWELRLDVDNLFDQQWDEGAYHYASRFENDDQASSLPRIHVVPGHPIKGRVQIKYHW